MKKLLYLLLLTPIIYLTSCSKSGVTPPENINNDNDDNIEEVIVGKTWKLLNLDEEWFILDNDSTYLKKDYQCDSLEQNGTWQLKDSVLSFKYTIGPLEYIERFTIVEYNDSIVKVNVDTTPTLDINIIFEIVPEGWGIFGCMNPDYANYNPEAVCPAPCNQGGCMDPTACNYNEFATYDDGSCQLPDGCTDPTACNYDPTANCDDGSCQISYGCTDSLACNYDFEANCDDGSCQLPDGCTDPTACNYDPTASCDDGSCLTIYGCIDPNASNYDPNAECDDGSCFFIINGCTDSSAPNYDPNATVDDGSCIGIGDFYEGGEIFWLDGFGGGLVCEQFLLTHLCGQAPGSNPVVIGAEWGCVGTYTAATGVINGSGQQNTSSIISSCSSPGIAADLCASHSSNNWQGILFDDWYLPSSDELLLLYQAYQADPSSFYAISAPMNHGCRIWTSTEVDNDHAIALSPGGTFTTENKSYFLQVIHIRQF